jgi:NDP-sugar pyrophosphorylase family protein
MKPTLVILAAGIGSRYGGLKQLEAVGPGGATIMDYSVYDARRAGFGKVVFVIRPDMEAEVRRTLGARYEPQLPVAYALQRLDSLPPGFTVLPGRTKPWGTGHAVLAAGSVIHEPFAAVNADDFYGADSFVALGEFLRQESPGDLPTWAMVGYALRDTLSDTGAVSRGICRSTSHGWLQSILETVGIERHGSDGRYTDVDGVARVLSGDTLVSMNIWGFTPAIFDELRGGFRRFLQEHAGSDTAEFYLPAAVQDAIAAGRARVKVLPTRDVWCGVTHVQDKARATAMISRLVARGVYPERLWG